MSEEQIFNGLTFEIVTPDGRPTGLLNALGEGVFPYERIQLDLVASGAFDFTAIKSSLKNEGVNTVLSNGVNQIIRDTESLDPELVRNTLNVILKFQEDIENVESEINAITAKITK